MADVQTTLQSILPVTASPKVMTLKDLEDGTHALKVVIAGDESASASPSVDGGEPGSVSVGNLDGGSV